MTKTILLLGLLLAFPVMAAEETGLSAFFTYVSGWFEDTYDVIANDVPSAFQRFIASIYQFGFIIWLHIQISSIEFAWGVAKAILEDLAFGSQLNSLLAGLPQDIRAFISLFRITDCIEILVSAKVTQFVLRTF